MRLTILVLLCILNFSMSFRLGHGPGDVGEEDQVSDSQCEPVGDIDDACWLIKLLPSLPWDVQVCMTRDLVVEENWLFMLLPVLIFSLLRLGMVMGNVIKA
jgi:hypothetical protein